LIAASDVTVGGMDFLSERNKLQIEKFNSKPLSLVEKTIHEVIYDSVCVVPDEEAVCSWDGNLSYRELDNLACRLATYLITLGVGPETVVPLCFEKSKWNVVAILATLYAGGACKYHPKGYDTPSWVET
jgi:non-ribosomal peptide synthetase component F